MAITSNKRFDQRASDSAFFYNDAGEGVHLVEGLVQVANSDGEVIDPATGAAAATGGGSSTYSTAQGDFTATPTVGTTNITVAGLPFILEAKHVVNGSIKKIDSSGVVTTVDSDTVSVSGSVITLAEADDFATGDSVVVSLTGPDKAYDVSSDSVQSFVVNPEYEHYTSVETLIAQADLGITGTATGTDSDTLTDSGAAFDAQDVALGYEAYSEEEDAAATVLEITDGTNIETDAITDWSGDTYWLPECERYIIPSEGFNNLTIHYRLSTDDADNFAYLKLYATLDADADDTDDTNWIDMSVAYLTGKDGFSTDQIVANNTTETDIVIIQNTPMLKWMIKIVGEVQGGGGAAAAAQDFDVYIKKSS